MEDILSLLVIVGMMVAGIVSEVGKRKKKPSAAEPFPLPDIEDDEVYDEVETAFDTATYADGCQPAGPPCAARPAATPHAAPSDVASPTPSHPAEEAVAAPSGDDLSHAVRQGIIWSEILQRKYI